MDRPPFAIPPVIALSAEPATSPGPRWVMARAEEELVTRYGTLDASERDLGAAAFDPPAGTFLVARHGVASRGSTPLPSVKSAEPADPIGGAGVRRLGLTRGEVKRLWVDPSRRGEGIGRMLMEALEDAALALGLTHLELATGDRQPEAVALYTSVGWERRLADRAGRSLPSGYIRFTKRIDSIERPDEGPTAEMYTHIYTHLGSTPDPTWGMP